MLQIIRRFFNWLTSEEPLWTMNTDITEPVVPTEAPKQPPMPVLPPQQSSIPPFKPMVLKWANSIKTWEGATLESHNPGNLKYSTLTKSWGAQKGRQASDGGFLCQFITDEQGMNALYNFLTLGCEGELLISHPQPCTLDQFTTRYAGNPPMGYKLGIAEDLGVPLTVDISTFLN